MINLNVDITDNTISSLLKLIMSRQEFQELQELREDLALERDKVIELTARFQDLERVIRSRVVKTSYEPSDLPDYYWNLIYSIISRL